jgi:multidrug efflux pump subunit AcrA (membrane-fusion protein)
MNFLLLALGLSLLACGESDEPASDEPAHDQGQLWTCGMHPNVVQDSPEGGCPICGMDLVPLGSPAASSTGSALSVHIEPHVVQNMGVRTERVVETTVFRHLRTLGEVEVGEDELSVVNLRTSGWVERIYVERTGDPVKRGQKLFELYSPELVAAQEEYLLALRSQGASSDLARSARRKLELWDIADGDIQAIASSGEVKRTMPVRSPSTGYVLHKDIVEGARVNAGKDLYRIGDLQSIWVTAEVYEFDAPWVEVGQQAQMELTYESGRVIEGEVAYIYPTLDPQSRTLKVRLEFENPGVRLKPGMFATVEIEYRRADDALAIPSEAILHSGQRQIVFVQVGEGTFEPREVTTGLVGDRHLTQVLEGLEVGDEVVLSGQFLIDSESQLQEAIQKMLARRSGDEVAEVREHTLHSCPMHPEVLSEEPGRCPECGMDLVERAATDAEWRQLHPSAPELAQPGQYTCPMHPQVVEDEPGRCPICNMFLEQVPEEAP